MQTQPHSNSHSNIELAIKHLRGNNLLQAESFALEHIANHPADTVIEKLLGVIYFRKKDFKPAIAYLTSAIEKTPEDIELLNLLGSVYLETCVYAKSLEYFRLALAINPNYIDAQFNLGLTYYKERKFSDAILALQKTLNLEKNNIHAKYYLALSFIETNQLLLGQEILELLIKDNPERQNIAISLCKYYIQHNKHIEIDALILSLDNDNTMFSIANCLLESTLRKKAIPIYQDLLIHSNDKSSILNNLAMVYDKLNQADIALPLFQAAIDEKPDYIDAHNNLGRLLSDMNRLPEAQKILLDALSLSPRHTKAHINLGRVYYLQNNLEKSIQCYQKALAIEANNALAHYNLGVSYNAMGLFEQAMASYMTCLSFNENHNDAELNLGICELTLGQFANGWGHYFQRHRFLKHKETLSTINPGKNYQGKHLYFCYSQGIGDELFFLRFLPLLKQQEVFITYRCSQKLYPLLLKQAQNPFIDRLLTEHEKTPTCDYYFTVDDLPLILAMDSVEKIPPSLKFDQPDKQLMDNLTAEFSALPRPFIGITWRAGTQPEVINHYSNQNNLSKIFPMNKMIDLFRGLKGTLFVLQRNPMVEEIDQLKNSLQQDIVDTSNYNDDLSRMLGLLNILDDSVCVSNTNLHLLAAMNKSANVLIPYPPDWRWMDIETCSPWFPGFKTFRQLKTQSWDVCLQQLKHKLLDLYAVD